MYIKAIKLHEDIREYRMRPSNQVIDTSSVRPIELKSMRYLRGIKPNELANMIGTPMKDILKHEGSHCDFAPKIMAEKYIVSMNIFPGEYSRLKMLMSGKVDEFELGRNVPYITKKEVFKRDNNKCTECGRGEKLHIHHIKRFSDGGTHHIDNLTLLCAECHAKEHKGEQSYKMLLHLSKE